MDELEQGQALKRKPYTAPVVNDLGTLRELTQGAGSSGSSFDGAGYTPSSPSPS